MPVPQHMRETADFVVPPELGPKRTVPSVHVRVDLAGQSHLGNLRTNNEDHFLVARFGRVLETLLTNLPDDDRPPPHEEMGYALLVADGIGGMAAGEVASRSAILRLIDQVVSTPDWILSADPKGIEEVMRRMGERFRDVHDDLLQQARDDPRLAGMGTTMTLACSLGLDMIICHVGDSRAYLYRDGDLRQLTRDMTLAQALVDVGQMTEAAASTSKLRHILTHCLGGANNVVVDLQHLELEPGDRVLLCTDGLSDMVEEQRLADALAQEEPAHQTCELLVNRALAAGGRDNVTVIVADYQAT